MPLPTGARRQCGCKAIAADNAASVGVTRPPRARRRARTGDRQIRRPGIPADRASTAPRASGQALVEFALVATILVLLLAGLSQFGLIAERQIGISNAVREAARRGATQATTSGNAATNATWTLGQLQTLLSNAQDYQSAKVSNMQVCFYTPASPNDVDPSGATQDWVTVQLTYAHPLFLPLINVILDGIDGTSDQALQISSSATFHVESSSASLGNPGSCAS
jgi:Flp pilus assembly protein TadG